LAATIFSPRIKSVIRTILPSYLTCSFSNGLHLHALALHSAFLIVKDIHLWEVVLSCPWHVRSRWTNFEERAPHPAAIPFKHRSHSILPGNDRFGFQTPRAGKNLLDFLSIVCSLLLLAEECRGVGL